VALGELTSLTSLHLTGCSTYVAEELGMERLEGLQWLAPSLAKLTALTSLHVAGWCWDLDDEQMEELSNLPALTYVHLDCYWDSEQADMRLWALASRLPGLTHLHLPEGDYDMSNDGLRAIASLRALTHLHLADCNQVTNEGMLAISSLISLTHLHLCCCQHVTNDGLPAIASLTSLTELHLQYFHGVTDEGVATLSSLTALKSLNLTGCGNVSQEAITALHWTSLATGPISQSASPSTCRSYCVVRWAAEGVLRCSTSVTEMPVACVCWVGHDI
jgi:F-box/leucine-rich repeat protein 14